MASPTTTTAAVIIGSTGFVGSNMLNTLLSTEIYKPVHTITRRAPQPTASSTNLNAIVEADTTKWAASLSSLATSSPPPPSTIFSALGTTRAAAGGVANQWKIDHDLNVELARAAKEAGMRKFVFVSSGGTRGFLSDRVPYSKMKIGVEDAVRDLEFEQAIILRPGMILGEREKSNATEILARKVVGSLHFVSAALQDKIGQEALVIARAGVRAAQLADEGKAPSKYWVLEQADIVRLGRTEWPEKEASPPAAAE
jgi:nucleoside-diphosphate-sugar epimerase